MTGSRRLTWIVYAVCVLLVIDGLGWVTWQMLGLERREAEAQRHARQQEVIRLALWRMDSLLAPIIAAEAARPYFQYRAFYPAERAYTRMWEEVLPGEVLVPSPLLTGPAPPILLHFEVSDDGWLASPQVPTGNMRDQAEAAYVPAAQVLDAERRLLALTAMVRGSALAEGNLDDLVPAREHFERLHTDRSREGGGTRLRIDAAPLSKADAEYEARQQAAEFARGAAQQQRFEDADRTPAGPPVASGYLVMPAPTRPADEALALGVQALDSLAASPVETGPLMPVWLADTANARPELVFVRAVRVEGRETLQGFWIDWPALRTMLLRSVSDLMPAAQLRPDLEGSPDARLAGDSAPPPEPGLMLAGIPAGLVPGAWVASGAPLVTPTRITLVVSWIAVLAAVVAIGLVLRASLALSERRGRFVSAVTHELRTPLTTFCLYSQMLADGMVPEGERRHGYLTTLKAESQRLAAIVESVLEYARLGTRRRVQACDATNAIDAAELLGEMVPALAERAARCGLTLQANLNHLNGARLRADRASVERILTNLVENACKYAAGADDRRLLLRARLRDSRVEVRLRDFGPGVPRAERRRIFSPFVRAARDADAAKPGLGLGLALSRGLARAAGGDLRLARTRGPGAEFVLTLPTAQ
ncbi:MAG TPA: HAMP domain-containing sensor histidine kinase [Phycisphaerales bacterium]|nr:HAMP domain-containing sensor histidine kinase [Phycisphaerales bacterium]